VLNREDGSDGLCGSFSLSDPMRSGWVTISDLARCEGVTKTAISRRVGRLVAKCKLETRTGTNRAKEVKLLFCSAEWLWCSYLTSHGVQNRASMSAGTPGLQRSFKLLAALLDQALRRSLIGFASCGVV
jgi:hypothetical protein